jgi:hypothetical protein
MGVLSTLSLTALATFVLGDVLSNTFAGVSAFGFVWSLCGGSSLWTGPFVRLLQMRVIQPSNIFCLGVF